MGPPVRTVCIACLHSLELSSADGLAGRATCPHCGHPVEPLRPSSDTSTTGDGLSLPPDPDALTPRSIVDLGQMPARIGRFVLREPLGEGGYGEVFRAYDPHLERDVALKVLKPTRLGEKALERFYREARAAARLDHPNIVSLHDAGRDEHRCWIAYQLVHGQTLSMLRDLGRPSVDESARIVRDLALALDHAHGRGVFHRDLKPANVLIDQSGRPRLTDFGLARRGDLDSDLTQEGTILGTPQYMSPEAAAGRAHEADGRSDVYSLGVILYELICGRRPADVPSNVPLWRSTRMTTPPTPRSVDREIPADLDRISMRALAFDPDARYPDARSFADALGRYLEGRPIADPRMEPLKGSLALGLVVAASVLCIALGMSLNVGARGAPRDLPSPPISGLIEAGSGASKGQAGAQSGGRAPGPAGGGPSHRTQAKRPAARPTPGDDPTLEELWGSPVVWIRGTDGMKVHRRGCQHLAKTPDARLEDLGEARAAVAGGYKPCKTCLGRLNLALPDRPAP